MISQEAGNQLVQLAREAIREALYKDSLPVTGIPLSLQSLLEEKLGLFVTLWMEKTQRGCLGSPYPDIPLRESIRSFAVMAALEDERYPPVSREEFSCIKIEISVLTLPKPIEVEQIQIGAHGLIVTYGDKASLLLPQVAFEQGWTVIPSYRKPA